MKKITKEKIKSRLESIGMDKSIAEDLAEIEFRAERINAAIIDKGKELKKEKAQIKKEQNIHMVLKKMIAAGLITKIMDYPPSDIPEEVINTARTSLSQLVYEDRKINFLPKEEWSDITEQAAKRYNDELIRQYNEDMGIEAGIDDDLKKSHDEMIRKEAGIDELMYAYHEIIEDLEQDNVDKSIMPKDTGYMKEMSEFHKLIDKSDANFYQFADLFFSKRKMKNIDVETAPDWLLDQLLVGEEPIERPSFWERFRKKEMIPLPAFAQARESLSWSLKPRVALLSFASALLVIFMLYPVFTDKNNISPVSGINYIGFKTPLESLRGPPGEEKSKDSDLVSFSYLKENNKINSKMIQFVSDSFTDSEKEILRRAYNPAAPPSLPPQKTGDGEFVIMNIEGIEIYKVEDQIAFKQLDKKERKIQLYRNNQLILSENSTDFQSENLNLLVVDLSSSSGNYQIIISRKNENILTKSFSIE